MGQSYEEILSEMEDTYTRLAGVRPADASDIGLRIKVLADQVWQLTQQVEKAEQAAFPQTAQGEWLDRHAIQKGLTRKPAVPAGGQVVFSRSTPAESSIPIPQGTTVVSKGDTGLLYQTEKEAVLGRGQSSVAVPVACVFPGKQGNLAAGRIGAMGNSVPGIGQVENPEPISGGEEAESDEALRRRLMDSYQMATNGTNQAFYYNMAMQYPGVSSVKILPRVKGSGTVGIVAAGPGVNSALLNRMKQEIGAVKEVNVDLTVEQAVSKPVAVAAEIAVKEGYSFSDTAALCKERLSGLAADQTVGSPFLAARWIQTLLECEGVANCRMISPNTDQYPLEKERITVSGITITEMPVRV